MDYFLTLVAMIFHLGDCAQTIAIARNPQSPENPSGWYEHNPILGRHPAVSEVLWYFGISGIVLCALIYAFAIGPYSGVATLIALAWAIVEFVAVWRNHFVVQIKA